MDSTSLPGFYQWWRRSLDGVHLRGGPHLSSIGVKGAKKGGAPEILVDRFNGYADIENAFPLLYQTEGYKFVYQDQINSTRQMSNSNLVRDYYPYGETYSSSGTTTFEFSQKEYTGGIGLYYFGALLDKNGKIIRAGAEGILAKQTGFWSSVFDLQDMLSTEDIDRFLNSERRQDLPGQPLTWHVALQNLVAQLTGEKDLLVE